MLSKSLPCLVYICIPTLNYTTKIYVILRIINHVRTCQRKVFTDNPIPVSNLVFTHIYDNLFSKRKTICVNTYDKWLYVEWHQQGYRIRQQIGYSVSSNLLWLLFYPLFYLLVLNFFHCLTGKNKVDYNFPHNHSNTGLSADSKGISQCFCWAKIKPLLKCLLFPGLLKMHLPQPDQW